MSFVIQKQFIFMRKRGYMQYLKPIVLIVEPKSQLFDLILPYVKWTKYALGSKNN